MSGNNYLQFIIEEVVRYFNSPPEERVEAKNKGKSQQGLYTNRWFGIFPFSFKLFIKNK